MRTDEEFSAFVAARAGRADDPVAYVHGVPMKAFLSTGDADGARRSPASRS